jgi:hypothetical protein
MIQAAGSDPDVAKRAVVKRLQNLQITVDAPLSSKGRDQPRQQAGLGDVGADDRAGWGEGCVCDGHDRLLVGSKIAACRDVLSEQAFA